MKIVIISHTPHYTDVNGIIKGWGPTIREINFLATKFEQIVHLGVMHRENPPESSIPYTGSNIRFVSLPESGGKSLIAKIKSLRVASEIISTINKEIEFADAIQLRIPTGMANYLLPYLSLNRHNKKIWVKYAGNWNQKNAPLGYQFQRWWLTNNFLKSKVTINGKWENQPAHCITFENPCLDEHERANGKIAIENKTYSTPFTACFIGRIEKEKGVERIIDSINAFKNKNISTIHFIGEGKEINLFSERASQQKDVKVIFHGGVDRAKIPALLINSHFLLLPSTASEGFPKVIAEGMNYGAIPIVSDVSSIGQYVNNDSGFVWDTKLDFKTWVSNLNLNPDDLKQKSYKGFKVSELFTFENYYKKLQTQILNDH